MTSPLIKVSDVAQMMQERPVTLLRAVMDDPITNTPDARNAMVLPASVDFDLDGEGSDHATGYPHSMPDVETLSLYLGKQGITENTPVVVYDTRGMFSAPRVWWMLKAIGHQEVYILDGGQKAWEAAGLPTAEQQQYGKLTYHGHARTGWFVNAQTVSNALETDTQLVDARSRPRFNGEVSEPRQGVRSGHMPGALNLPFMELLNNGHLKEVEKLYDTFKQHSIDLTKPIICTCGSGVTACIVGIAAVMCGATQISVYDGSWSEWGADLQYPVVTTQY